ncbi:MAG TPA: hypothetical protein VFB50_17510, partial [Chloroflexota bacterium]|nr:hypothetical protein [Chloroflexota bacterium]
MPYTLAEYRHRLADAAGFNIITSATATASQANQVVVADFASTELETTFLGNTWEYQPSGPNAGQIRKVVYGGLNTGAGIVTLEAPHTAVTPSGTPLEFYGKLPPIRREGRIGLNDLVNRVLAECWTIQKLPIAGVQDQRVYPLGTLFPWLHAEDQIVEVYYLGANSGANATDQLMVNWRWVPGADNPGLEIAQTLNTGDTLKLQAFVPMHWWINTGTGWGLATSAAGLQAETDQAILPITGMEVLGSAWIYQELAKWGLPEDQTTFRQLRAQSRAAGNEWKRLTLEHPKVR